MIVAAFEAVALVAVVGMFLRFHFQASKDWALERRELLTRIQRPELIPSDVPQVFAFPEPEVDESALVGTIHMEDE